MYFDFYTICTVSPHGLTVHHSFNPILYVRFKKIWWKLMELYCEVENRHFQKSRGRNSKTNNLIWTVFEFVQDFMHNQKWTDITLLWWNFKTISQINQECPGADPGWFLKGSIWSNYCTDMYLDRQAWANSVDPDQMPRHLIRVYSVFHLPSNFTHIHRSSQNGFVEEKYYIC